VAPTLKSFLKPVVVHFVETFLSRSEVFIYNYVASHVAWDPLVLCKFTANENEFPVSRQVVIPAPITKRDPAWWLNEAVLKLTGRSFWHRRAEAVLRELKPSVIHAHFGHVGYGMLPLSKRLRLPLVTTFYGYDMSVLPRRHEWRRKFAKLFREGDLFLVEGPCMRDRLLELGAPGDKVRIQRIAIQVNRYPAWQPAGAEPVALFVGRFAEKKGLLPTLAAVHNVRRRGLPLRLRIIGDGVERFAAERFVAEHGMCDAVDFLGMKAHGEMIQELSRTHVFVHPSRTATNGDTEGGAPTILLEAQAVGVPIVSTLHADIPNIVGNGQGVYLSPETNAEQLAENLFTALHRREGANPAFVRQHHDVAREILNLEKHYREVASV